MLSHVNKAGKAVMVNIQYKRSTVRTAIAQCIIKAPANVYKAVLENSVKKGDVLAISRFAGIMGAKNTSNLIPLCHQINLDSINVDIKENKVNEFLITSKVVSEYKTGVEMEALTAVTIAGLTFYDMCKGISKEIQISDIKLIKKTGGKSDYQDYDV